MINEYTKKDFETARMLLCTFIALYLLSFVLGGLVDIIEMPEIMNVAAICGGICMPILIILSCHMCIERYLYLEFYSEGKSGNTSSRRAVYAGIGIMTALGAITFYHVAGLISFVMDIWTILGYMETLYVCIAIKLGITGCCLFCWIYSMKRSKTVQTGKKVKISRLVAGILMFVFLAYISAPGNRYVKDQVEDARFRKMMDESAEQYYEQFGVYPF